MFKLGGLLGKVRSLNGIRIVRHWNYCDTIIFCTRYKIDEGERKSSSSKNAFCHEQLVRITSTLTLDPGDNYSCVYAQIHFLHLKSVARLLKRKYIFA